MKVHQAGPYIGSSKVDFFVSIQSIGCDIMAGNKLFRKYTNSTYYFIANKILTKIGL